MEKLQLPTLYGRTKTGAIQQWLIEVEDDKYRTVYGQVGGKIQTTMWTICQPTNEGKANYRDGNNQAVFEAHAIFKKKQESGYHENIDDVDKTVFIEPMLAKKYVDYKDEIVFPIYSQGKCDGCRAIITKDGMFSRTGKRYIACPHITKELEPFFSFYPNAILDGELYNHELKHDFNKITSIVKKTKPTPADLAEASIVQYWVYDMVYDAKFSERNKFVESYLKGLQYVKVLPTTEVCNEQELDSMYEQYLSDGFEGQMIRLDTTYENGRTKALLKRKDFQDAEYEIIDITEGEGNLAGNVGRVTLKTESGETFMASVNGSREFTADIWKNKDEYIGKLATVKFFNLTPPPRCVPRFGKVVSIRNYE